MTKLLILLIFVILLLLLREIQCLVPDLVLYDYLVLIKRLIAKYSGKNPAFFQITLCDCLPASPRAIFHNV